MKIKLLFLTGLLTLVSASQAFALSTESRSGQNTDGTSKFADPDEQQPAFMINSFSSNGAPLSPSSSFSNVTIPATGNMTPGAQDFDQAVSRQQNRQ